MNVHRRLFVIIDASPPQHEQRSKSHNCKRCSTYIARASPTEATIIESKSKAEHSDNVPLSRPENRLHWRVIRTTYFVNLRRNYQTIEHARWNLHPLYTHEPPPTALALVVFIWSIGICAVTVLTCICIPTPTPTGSPPPCRAFGTSTCEHVIRDLVTTLHAKEIQRRLTVWTGGRWLSLRC